MPRFRPVRTVAEFKELDEGEVLEGYLDGFSGAPAPGPERSRGYWHGWRNGMIESGRLPADRDYAALAEAFRILGEAGE